MNSGLKKKQAHKIWADKVRTVGKWYSEVC